MLSELKMSLNLENVFSITQYVFHIKKSTEGMHFAWQFCHTAIGGMPWVYGELLNGKWYELSLMQRKSRKSCTVASSGPDYQQGNLSPINLNKMLKRKSCKTDRKWYINVVNIYYYSYTFQCFLNNL